MPLSRGADLVVYWFERVRGLIEQGRVKRSGLLATQSIRTAANRATLARIKQSVDIFMAWQDRPWVLDEAAVRVSMVGFDDGNENERSINGQPVVAINSDLTGLLDLTQARQLEGNKGLAFVGSQKIGPFDIDADVAQRLIALPMNPNGRLNADVIKPSVNGSDLTGRSRNKWIIDFGLMNQEKASLYEAPFEYVRNHVYPGRNLNRRAAYA